MKPEEVIFKNPDLIGWEYILQSLREVGLAITFEREGIHAFAGKLMLAVDDWTFDFDASFDWSDFEQMSIVVYGINPMGAAAGSFTATLFRNFGLCSIWSFADRQRLEAEVNLVRLLFGGKKK